MSKILAFSGSARKDSFNQKLVQIAAQGARDKGAEVTVINLVDYPMPIFNQDLETQEGLPDNTKRLKKILMDHDALLIASPEYNSSFSPLLKNTIDWCSRVENENESPLVVFRGKTAAIMSASPGALGGLRGLVFLRMLLQNIGIMVLPAQQALIRSGQAFAESGHLNDHKKQKMILDLGGQLADVTTKFI